MSLPGGNFIANGVVVHNSNFLGAGKVTTGSASGGAEDKATMIYNALARRVKSRYKRHGVTGLVLLVSSKRSTEDFTEQRIRRAIKDEDAGLFVRDYAIWNVHPEPFRNQKWYRMFVSPSEGRTRLLQDGEDPPEVVDEADTSLTFRFPEDYYDEFLNDPDGATRDIAGIATDFAARLFIGRRTAIAEMMDLGRPNPFKTQEWSTDRILQLAWSKVMTKNANDEPVPLCCAGAIRHVHIDMSTNLCATGFCFGHLAGHRAVARIDKATGLKIQEEAPVIHIDGVLRIVAPDGGDVDHAEVRGLVYRLMQGGYPIRSVSMDQYMSPPNLQMLKRKGLRTAEVGERVARMKPYLMARQSIYEGRVSSPQYDHLYQELKSLELDKTGKKVNHPPKGSKDLADAWAGTVYYISENMRSGVVLAPTKGLKEVSLGEGPQWTSDGNVIWGDEEPMPPPPGSQQNQGYGSWIV